MYHSSSDNQTSIQPDFLYSDPAYHMFCSYLLLPYWFCNPLNLLHQNQDHRSKVSIFRLHKHCHLLPVLSSMQASSCPASPIYCSARDLPQSNLLPIRHQLIFQMLHNHPAYSDLHVYHRILKDHSRNNVHHSVLPEVLHHQCHIRCHTFPHLPYKR